MNRNNYNEAVVIESLPSVNFIVRFEDGTEMRAYLGGRLKQHFIRINVGDTVVVFVPDQGNIGRITKRK